MSHSWIFGNTEPGQDGGLATTSWPLMGGIDPGATNRFRVDGGEWQEANQDADGIWDWNHGQALDNGEHTIEWSRTDASGAEETIDWSIEVDEDSSSRQLDYRRAQEWEQGGRDRWRQANAPTAAAVRQGVLTGGGGAGGASSMVTAGAGAGGAAAVTGTAEKGNAQPQVEKGNAR